MRRGLFLLILVVTGCAHVPKSDYAQRYGPIPIENTLEVALAKDFFEEGGWPSEEWWEIFDDPQLSELVQLALRENPTIQGAMARVAKAEQEARKEKAAYFPKLDFAYNEQWEYFSKNGFVRSFYHLPEGSIGAIPPTANQLDLSLYFNYEVDFFGRNRNLFKAALGRARAEYAESRQATLIITTLLVQTYIELQTRLAQREVIVQQLETQKERLELASARQDKGLNSSFPTLDEQKMVYNIEKSLREVDQQIALDRHMLSVLAGQSPTAEIAPLPMRAIFNKSVSLPKDLSSDLLARRADLTAQIWRVEAAAKEIGAAKADFYPRVNLMAFAQLESLSFSKLFNIGSRQGALSPALHLPIFTGGKLKANLREKVALFNVATLHYNQMLLNAVKEVVDQIAILSKTVETLQIQKKLQETAEIELKLKSSCQEVGTATLLGVLHYRELVLNENYLLLQIQRNYLLAVLKMIKALGGGYY